MQPTQSIPLKHARLILGLVLIALVLQDFIWLAAVQVREADWPAIPGIVAIGLAFGQSALAAILLVWGRGWLLLRGCVALAMIVLAGAMGAQAMDEQWLPVWISVMLAYAAVVAVPLVVARMFGPQVTRAQDEDSRGPASQFSLWELVSVTTLTALLLGLARWLQPPPDQPREIALFLLVQASVPWICAPLALSRLAWRTVLPVSVAASIGTGWLASRTGFPPPEPLPLMAMSAVQTALILAACAAVRFAGYELTRPARAIVD